jgi:hypothetical protein|uniref:Uncharacterized protein n=1 Tax=Bacteriophage sp. TaxID=38018 RepID=A0A7G9A3X9_9VIRU|nr:MAG: hypothetical protein [Bacteriophage sp.]
MRPSRTTAKATRSAVDAFKAAEPKPQEPVKAFMLYSIAFTTKYQGRIWNRECADGTVRLVGTVTKISNVTHQGSPIDNGQLAGLTVEVRVTPDQFETITDNIADMMGGGVSILFEVGEPSFSVLTVNGMDTHSITFYSCGIEGMEVNKTSIGGLGFESKPAMDAWLLAARSQNNARQERRQLERTSRLAAARAAADAAGNDAEWAAPAASTNPME